MRKYPAPLLALLLFATFLVSVTITTEARHQRPAPPAGGRVVISAPLQLLMYAGDRFLGANLETTRVASSGVASGEADAVYLIRAHRVVAQLNPCHEDNYYLGNALLSWGGAESEGSDLLRRATACRHWDELPPFFYGVNQYFFRRDVEEARHALEIAASRSRDNAAALRKFSIMIAVGEIQDVGMALTYLRNETEQASDPQLKTMLEKRVRRLEGLVALREAQRLYESRFSRPLTDPYALLNSGILDAFPSDPLGIGYEFLDGGFRLRELKIMGLERQK